MAVPIEVSNSEFFTELSSDPNGMFSDFLNKYFSLKSDKTLHCVDTFYFSVYLEQDTAISERLPEVIINLCDFLREQKNSLRGAKEDLLPLNGFDNLFVSKVGLTNGYGYRLTRPECFDIGFMDGIPNEKTPRIQVQLRSAVLWNNGILESVNEVFDVLKSFLDFFEVKIRKIMETRLDYSYHTNIMPISSMLSMNSKGDIKNLYTTLSVTNFYGYGSNSADSFSVEKNGVSFGSRKHKNIEVAIYDKAREIITNEKTRKGYFILQWYNAGLISFYDKYCYEYAYKAVSMEAIYKAKLSFYVKYGNDKNRIDYYKYMLSKDLPLERYRKAAKYMPPLTPVVNIEYRTYRKFYSSLDFFIDNWLTCSDFVNPLLRRLYKMIQNRNLWLDSLTSDVLHFRKPNSAKDKNFKSWWKRLRGTKIQTLGNNGEILRKYSSNLDVQTILRRITRSVGANAVYGKRLLTSFLDDFKEIINHMGRGYGYKLVFSLLKDKTKIPLKDFTSEFLLDYKAFKKKKYALIRNRLSAAEPDISSG